MPYLWIAIGSAMGGMARYWCAVWSASHLGELFPWGTLIVNVAGSFIIGFFGTLTGADGRLPVGTEGRLFVMVGFCGGFTTFVLQPADPATAPRRRLDAGRRQRRGLSSVVHAGRLARPPRRGEPQPAQGSLIAAPALARAGAWVYLRAQVGAMHMLAQDLLFEMPFERKIAEQKVRGREETVNEHLAKLLAFEASPELRAGWKRELLRKHLSYFASLRLKTKAQLIPRRDWWAWLYAEPFGGNEEGYMRHLIALHEDEYSRNARPLSEITTRLREFHAALADRLARGDPAADLLEPL
jgi:protein CrcB